MKHVTLGHSALRVSALGLGCMGMSEFYGPSDEAESLATLTRALELGVTLLDTADMYGPFHNERLLGRFLKGRREQVVLATKFGVERSADGTRIGLNNRPEYVQSACEASLARLETDVIDLYYAHRIDPRVPIEETVGAMAGLVRAGKVRTLGLSEVSAATLKRAAAVHPIAALQTEYSLFTRDVETEILPACRELGTTLVAYSPLGRGLLTGVQRLPETLAPSDYRRDLPRFQGEAAEHNARLVARLAVFAHEAGCTPPQLALAWLLSQGADVVPIPGTRRRARLEENVAALEVGLSPALRREIDEVFRAGAAAGERYTPAGMRTVNV